MDRSLEIPCEVQPDPNKFQRQNCSKITDQTILDVTKRAIEHIQSKGSKMIKFQMPMVYQKGEAADYYLNVQTGDSYLFHLNGKFWTYHKFDKMEIMNLMKKSADGYLSLQWASQSQTNNLQLPTIAPNSALSSGETLAPTGHKTEL